MANKTSVNIGARLDRLPQSKWHVKIWLVTAFALLVCWSYPRECGMSTPPDVSYTV